MWCNGCDAEKGVNFAPSQAKHHKYHYCRDCMKTVKKLGHYPKTLKKLQIEKERSLVNARNNF